VVRKFSLNRFRTEFARDGNRLIKKIWNKLFLKEKSYQGVDNSIVTFRNQHKLKIKNIEEFKKYGTSIIKCDTLNDKIVEDHLAQIGDDKLVIFTGGGIIRNRVLNLAGDGVINCHMGILPKYKGMDLPEWCILENAPDQLGLTLHFMDQGIDTGDILKKVKIPLGDHKSIKSLRAAFEPIMVDSMVSTVDDYLNGRINPTKQPVSDNRQYFIVHERLYKLAEQRLRNS
jgi:methionyl-tRNA formyltransferase